jgi:chlorophyllide a reductase subunit Y
VRIIGIDVPGFGVPTHAEAKDVLAGAMLEYARGEAEQAPCRRPGGPVAARSRRWRCSARCSRSIRSASDAARAPGARRRVRWCRRASGVNSTPRSIAPPSRRCCIPSTPRRSASSRPPDAPSSAPRRWARRHRGLARAIGEPATCRRGQDRGGQERPSAGDQAARSPPRRSTAHHPVRLRGLGAAGRALLIESRRRPALRRHRLSATPWSDADREWLEARGVQVNYRASLEEDIAAIEEYEPDLAIGTTPVVQHAKEQRDSRRCTSPT